MKKALITALILLGLHHCAYAQDLSSKISLSTAMEMALNGNIELQEKRKSLGIARNEIKAANQLKNPQFQSNILTGKISKANSSQVGVMLPIEIAKRGVRKEAAKINAVMVQHEVQQYEFDLKLRIRTAYFNLLQAKSDLKIMEERKVLLDDLLQLAKSKPKNTETYNIDVLQADMRLKKQLIAINRAKANVKTAQYNLNRIMNLENPDTFFDSQEDSLFDKSFLYEIQVPPYEEAEKIALENRHDLLMAKQKIEKSKKEVEAVKRQRIPDIAIGGGYAFSMGKKSEGEHLTGAYVGVAADLPLLYQYTPEIKSAMIAVEKTELDYKARVNITKNTLKTNYDKFLIAKENVHHYDEIINESNQILKLSREHYKKGKGSLMNMIINEHTHQEYMNEYISAVGVYYNTYIALIKEMGLDSFTAL